jgi:DNA-binding transcriptional regulator PaaX
MGSHNLRARRLGRIEHEIMQKLSLGDLAYGFLVSARSTKIMNHSAAARAKERHRRKCSIERLRGYGFVSGKDFLTITPAGMHSIYALASKNRAQIGKQNWDHKWYIVAYDIPVRLSPLRNTVRRILKSAGFVHLQQSLWIFPYKCEELVQLIKSESKLSRHIFYGVLERIEDEEKFKKIFKLE